MRSMTILCLAAGCLSGCAVFYDAPRISEDHGRAQAASWSRQIAFQSPAAVDRIPEGLGGLPAEEIMKNYNQSFGMKPTRENVFELGIGRSENTENYSE